MPERTDKGVEIPDELAIALAAAPDAKAAFAALAPSHQREWAEQVDDAKQPDTRQRRAAKCVEELRGEG
ncbi:MAG TPA: YdeI/OmpD-associated family protein [Acidimicrobiia bacterium]